MKEKQTEMVLAMLKRRPHGITALDALEECGCFRLAARIDDLKHLGYKIESAMIAVPGRDGRQKRVARYWLSREAWSV